MQEWIINTMSQYGYLGIALLIAIENVFPPIPSELILTFGGFMTTYSTMNPWIVVLFATIGSVIGACILYGVGLLLPVEKLELLVDRWGHILGLKKSDIKRAEGWFEKKGTSTIFFCRFIPLIRSLISIPAGMAKMNMGKFLIYTTIGTFIWNIVLVFLGAFAGEKWSTIVHYMDLYSNISVAIMAVIAVGIMIYFIKKRKKSI